MKNKTSLNEVSLITDEDAEVIFRSYKQENKEYSHESQRSGTLGPPDDMWGLLSTMIIWISLHLFNSF